MAELHARDPLRNYVHSSWASEWVAGHIADAWIYWHAANSGGKSHSLGHLWVAFLRGVASLGGVGIPVIKPPVAGAIGTPTYKLGAAGSIIDKIREAIGTWPHHEERVAGSVSVFHVMHEHQPGDDWHKWSKLYVLPYEGPIPEGPRFDFVGPDEPAPPLWLDAIMNRGKAGRKLYVALGATPIERSKWFHIRERFPKSHCVIENGMARVCSSVYDNRFLTPDDIERQERANPPSSPYSKARLLGEHVDASGECPFDGEAIKRIMLEDVKPHEEMRVPLKIETREGQESVPRETEIVTVEVWEEPVRGQMYYISSDPSSGIQDMKHHPAEVHVSRLGSGDLVARWHGRMSGHNVGVLCATLARQYNSAKIDIEMNDRWGANVYAGVVASGYWNFCMERRKLGSGLFADEPGFHNTAKSRPEMIGAIQTWLTARTSGVVYGRCPSQAVLDALLDIILDEQDRVVAPAGLPHHGEAMICLGQKLRVAVSKSGREVPALYRPPDTPGQKLADMIRGKNGHPTPLGVPLLRAGNPPKW